MNTNKRFDKSQAKGARSPTPEPEEGEPPEAPPSPPQRRPVGFLNYAAESERLRAAILLCAYSVEEYLIRPDLFGLATASKLQRAICRVIGGYPLDGSVNPVNTWPVALERILARTAADKTGGRDEAIATLQAQYDERLALVSEDLTAYPEVLEAFGGKVPYAGVKEFMVVAAIRCAKTLIAGAALAHRSMVADLDGLLPGESARAGIISWRVDLANTCFEFITSAFEASPLLRTQVLDPPRWFPGAPKNIHRVYNHVSDRVVDIMTLAANRGGASALSKWYVGFVVDEAARMLADYNDGVINYGDIRRAVFQRIRHDGFYLAITSPWLSVGPVYEAQKKLGVHEENGLCVAWAPGWHMNPITWTPEACAAAKERDAESYLTDVEARFARTDELAIDHALIRDMPRVRAVTWLGDEPVALADVAVLDAGLRKDGIALAFGAMVRGRRTLVGYVEWLGTPDAPLELRKVAFEIGMWMRRFNQSTLAVDWLNEEAFRELLFEADEHLGVTGWSATGTLFAVMATRFEHRAKLGELAIVDDERVRDDLASIRRTVSNTGEAYVGFPMTHSMRASTSSRAVLVALSQLYATEENAAADEQNEEKRMREARLRRHGYAEDPSLARDQEVDRLLEQWEAIHG